MIAAPLNAVVDLVGEVPQSAESNLFLRRVFRISILFGDMRHDHLGVGLGAQCSCLKKGQFVPDATIVDV